MPDQVVFAAATLSTANPADGVIIAIVEGEVWAADDPFVRARPDLFTDVAPVVRRTAAPAVIEQATKAPGERRSVKRG